VWRRFVDEFERRWARGLQVVFQMV
jgi:hypothetical protein